MTAVYHVLARFVSARASIESETLPYADCLRLAARWALHTEGLWSAQVIQTTGKRRRALGPIVLTERTVARFRRLKDGTIRAKEFSRTESVHG